MIKQACLASAAALVMAGTALAQEERTVQVESFDSIDAWGGFELRVSQGETQSVRLEGRGEDLDKLEVEVRRGELRIDPDINVFGRNNWLDAVVYVTVTDIESLDFSRGLEVEVAGLEVDNLDLEVHTGAVLSISGSCNALDLETSTGSVTRADAFVCGRVDVSGTTGSVADVHAYDSVRARANMGAAIDIAGAPSSVDVRSSMGGDIDVDRTG